MSSRLDELVRRGVAHVTSYVPWHAVETDLTHALPRFLQEVSERRMTVSLILTPEVGFHYTNSGLPKDVISKPEHLAKNSKNGPVIAAVAPNSFALPSLFSPEFMKRYHNFLTRVDTILADLAKLDSAALEGVTLVLTGSYWKYYRAASSSNAASAVAGDYSTAAGLAYRQRVDQYFAQREFSNPDPSAANRWKTRAMDEVNRRWFYQQSEAVFRNRSRQMIGKRARSIPIQEIELYTPEADPEYAYSAFLQSLGGGGADFGKLSQLVEEFSSRASSAGGSSGEALAPSFLNWSSVGGFRSLAESEKQFLFLKSLLLTGGRGGGVYIDERDWYAMSAGFRARAESLARSIAQGDLRLPSQALYLTSSLWSGSGASAGGLWDDLRSQLGVGARVVSSVDLVVRDPDTKMVLVDPSFIMTHDALAKLLSWSKPGRVLVLPRSTLYTQGALFELENVSVSVPRPIEIDLEVRYRLYPLESGKLVIYDLPHGGDDSDRKWQRFIASLLAVSGIEAPCKVTDPRLLLLPLRRPGAGFGLFVMNSSARPVTADLVFPAEVRISDLTTQLASGRRPAQSSQAAAPSSRFVLEVPPHGILPLAVQSGPERARESVAAQAEAASLARPGQTQSNLWN